MFIVILSLLSQPATPPIFLQARHAPFATVAACEEWKGGETERLRKLFASAPKEIQPAGFKLTCVEHDGNDSDDGSI